MPQFTDSILGQHLALPVAAHLARTQLIPDPPSVYDAQRLTDTLDAVGNALAVAIARRARDGRVANLAMQLVSAVHEASRDREEARRVDVALARLRTALEEAGSRQ